MRVVFMGTPEAAVPSLVAVAENTECVAVYTRPDSAQGRGRRVSSSPVKRAASDLGITVHQPKGMRREEVRAELAALRPDAIAVVAYGLILPAQILEIPRLACVNVHFSLLPRWRGAAPVERAVMEGDSETGVTTMLMDEGMDTGPTLMVERTPIEPDDTTGSLTKRLAVMGASLLVSSLRALEAGTVAPSPQPADGVAMAAKITSEEAELDLGRPAIELERRVRALAPAPGAFTWIGGKRVKVWRAQVVPGEGRPCVIAAVGPAGVDVQAGGGRLRLLDVQPEGKRTMSGAEFARGQRLAVGDVVGRPG